MRALPHGRSASLSRPATSSGRLSEQSHEFRNLNNGVNPLNVQTRPKQNHEFRNLNNGVNPLKWYLAGIVFGLLCAKSGLRNF